MKSIDIFFWIDRLDDSALVNLGGAAATARESRRHHRAD